jgi:hypothetical protein
MKFTNLEQRMVQTYIDMFPKFIPDKNAKIGIVEQEKFYSLMKDLYQLAFNEPLLFVSFLHEDDVYPYRYKKSYGKPDLINNMRKFIKTMDLLLQNMYLIGKGSNINIDKRQQEILSRLGINNYNKLPLAWTWMANRPESNIIEFIYCHFDKNYPYTSDIYADLLGEAAFRKLENWMISQGYRRYDIYNLIGSDCKLSLTYANPLWDKTPPRGGHEYKIRHTGISAQYDFFTQQPAIFGLCIPKGLKLFLDNFQSMETKTKNFVISQTKKRDKCRYCVQTDKTNTRPLAFVKVNIDQKDYNLCTYFPGYAYSWTYINNELVEQLIDMLVLMDKYIPKNRDKK